MGGLGFNYYPFLFYGRGAVGALLDGLGKDWFDAAPEYASMNSLAGALLACGIVVAIWKLRETNAMRRLLVVLFALVFGFFALIRPGVDAVRGVDPVVWFWVSPTLVAAVLLAGESLSGLRGWWRGIAYGATAAVCGIACVLVFGTSLGMPSRELGTDPESLVPADGRMVDVRTVVLNCAVCREPRLELFDITIQGSRAAMAGPEFRTADVEGYELGSDDRHGRFRATLDPDGKPLWYSLAYRVWDGHERADTLVAVVRVPLGQPLYQPRYWTH